MTYSNAFTSIQNLILKTARHPAAVYVLVFLVSSMFAVSNVVLHDWGADMVSPFQYSDAEIYQHYAWMMAFVDTSGGELAKVVPPSPYVLLLVSAYKIFGSYLSVPFLLNAFLLAWATAFMFALCRNLFNTRTAIIAATITCLCGPFVFFAGFSMKAVAIPALIATSLFFLERFYSLKKLPHLCGFVFFTTLLILERNNFLLFVPVIPVFLFLFAKTKRTGFIYVTITAATFVLTLTMIRAPFSDAHTTSPLGTNFYIGNSLKANGAYIKVPRIRNNLIGHHIDAYEMVQKLHKEPISPLQADMWWIEQTFKEIAKDPSHFVLVNLRKVAMMMSAYSPDVPNYYPLWRWNDPFLSIALFDHGVILSLGCIGLFLLMRRSERKHPFYIYLLCLLAYGGTVTTFFVLERYRMPITTALIPVAAYALANITKLRVRGGQAFLALYFITHALNAMNPISVRAKNDPDFYRSYLIRERGENLQRHLLKVSAIKSNNPEDWKALSYAYFKLGFKTDSRLFLKKHRELLPRRENN